jgi:hypothetical protein
MSKKILAIGGLIGSGKDTIAEYLVNNHQFTKLSFAASLKDAVSAIFGWDRSMLEGDTMESRQWREQVDQWWSNRLNIPHLTPRWVLQYWGTEVCRVGFHEDIWVASLENKILKHEGNIVITDARFANELQVVKTLDGQLIRVERGPRPYWYEHAVRYNTGKIRQPPLDIHASEYSSVGLDYDYYIENNTTKEELFKTTELLINL